MRATAAARRSCGQPQRLAEGGVGCSAHSVTYAYGAATGISGEQAARAGQTPAPAAAPKDVLDTIFKAAVEALQAPAVMDAFSKQNFIVVPSRSLDDAKAWLAGQITSWKNITTAVKIETAE